MTSASAKSWASTSAGGRRDPHDRRQRDAPRRRDRGPLDNRAQLYKDIAGGPFFGFNRPGAKASSGLADSFFAQGMQAGAKATYDSIEAFFHSDFRADLKKVNVPTLVIHGADDQIVPIETTGRATARLVKGARLIEYADGPHGITDTHKDRLNQDLLDFIRQ